MSAPDPSPRGPGLAAFLERRLPFWEPQLVVLAAIVIDVTLPDRLSPLGPAWVLPALESVLLIGLIIASPHPRMRHSPLRRQLALTLIGVVSVTNIISLTLLCHYLLRGGGGGVGASLIRAGFGLWLTNVLLFGLWYWELDRGGPVARMDEDPDWPDFLFPQMSDPRWAPPDWRPRLIDYLYVSLTNATAFSPTDTMPLSRMAKVLMGIQALAALLTVGLVVARAVNILG